MSREIKFRAWDNQNQTFIKFGFAATPLYSGLLEPNAESIELLQYTGLKDKSGVEIYEGDVLRHQHHKNDVAVMEWLVDGWKCRIDTPKGPRWHEFYEGRSDDYGSGRNGWYEVIGNIYENPELLS